MTNREFYKEKLIDIAFSGDGVAIDRETLVPCKCEEISCQKCIKYKPGDCNHDAILKWAKSEHVVPCPFEKGELVEVSHDGIEWRLCFFVEMTTNEEFPYYCDYNKSDSCDSNSWRYCRKYGTLGGLVKEEE